MWAFLSPSIKLCISSIDYYDKYLLYGLEIKVRRGRRWPPSLDAAVGICTAFSLLEVEKQHCWIWEGMVYKEICLISAIHCPFLHCLFYIWRHAMKYTPNTHNTTAPYVLCPPYKPNYITQPIPCWQSPNSKCGGLQKQPISIQGISFMAEAINVVKLYLKYVHLRFSWAVPTH